MSWLVPRTDLTPDQATAVELPYDRHKLILGRPGSGKTNVLAHRARYLLDKHSGNAKFRIFVFTNILKEFISADLNNIDLDVTAVGTFDFWCKEAYEAHVGRAPMLPTDEVDWDNLRHGLLTSLRARAGRYLLDFVVIDEGQDLSLDCFEILKLASRHVTVCADYSQKIYEQGAEIGALVKVLEIDKQNVNLLGAYRNSPQVGYLASHFIDDPADRAHFQRQVSNNQSVRELPMLYYAKSSETELARLVDVVRMRQRFNQSIGIFLPTRKYVFGIKKALQDLGLNVYIALPGKFGGSSNVSFGSEAAKITTYHSAKGLTFDCVCLPRLSNYCFGRLSRRKNLLFVGITRSTKWVYLSTTDSSVLDETKILNEACLQKHLVIQKESAGKAFTVEQSDDDDVGLL